MEAAAVLEFRPARSAGVAPMTDEELKRRYTEIKLTRNDYRFGELFAEAETRSRTQEEIQQVLGLGKSQVSRLVEFGRFCRFIFSNSPVGETLEIARSKLLCTPERLFRKFWTETKDIGNTIQRYREIYDRLEPLPIQDTHEKMQTIKRVKNDPEVAG